MRAILIILPILLFILSNSIEAQPPKWVQKLIESKHRSTTTEAPMVVFSAAVYGPNSAQAQAMRPVQRPPPTQYPYWKWKYGYGGKGGAKNKGKGKSGKPYNKFNPYNKYGSYNEENNYDE